MIRQRVNWIHSLVLCAGLALALVPIAALTEQPVRFLDADPSKALPATMDTPASTSSRHQATVNIDALVRHESATLSTHFGDTLVLKRQELEQRGGGAFAWHGQVHDQQRQVGLATFTVQAGRVEGRFATPNGRFRVLSDSEGHHWLDQVNLQSMPARHPPVTLNDDGGTLQQQSTESIMAREGGSSTSEPARVDVIAYHTWATVAEYPDETALRLSIRNTIDMANTALMESEVDHRFRLLGIIFWDHLEGENMSDSLVAFARDNAIANARQLYAADLNTLFGVYDDFCGIAYSLREYDDDWELGFSTNNLANNYPCLEIQVVAHELGHNLGLHHDPDNAPLPQNMIEPFAYGHLSENEFSTIMAYHPGCGGGEYHNCFANDFFSNPNVTDPGSGLATGIENERDNAEVLRRTMPMAARWRRPSTSLANAAGLAGMHFETGGSSPWVPQNRVRFNDGSTLVSGPVYGTEESRLVMSLEDLGLFSFIPVDAIHFSVRHASGDTSDGQLSVFADGAEIGVVDAFSDTWAAHRFPVPEGTREITWIWQSNKRPGIDDGLGVIFLGNTRLEPGSTTGSSSGCTLSGGGDMDPIWLLLLLLGVFGRLACGYPVRNQTA